MASDSFALIGDIVGSRHLMSRSLAQQRLNETLEAMTEKLEPLQPLQATVGDEFQGAFSTLAAATRASLLLRLALLPVADTRYGIGRGRMEMIDPTTTPFIQDGSAWWAARDALKQLSKRTHRNHRTWVTTSGDLADPVVNLANSYLMCRDAIVDRLNPRGREMLLSAAQGASQAEVAHELGVTEGAVSQQFTRGIAAVRDAQALLEEELS